MARRASMIIAPSEWTRSEITNRLGIRAEGVRVIHEAARESMVPVSEADAQAVLAKHGIEGPYLLYVGTIEPRKNLLTLVRAYEELIRTTRHKVKLVLCGGRGWLDDEVFKMVDELDLAGMVGFTGYVDDADLPALYSQAEVFVYPSLYEGFGLPPLEAMACGTCVVTSDSSSLPEVVGEAGLQVPARDWRALAATIAGLLNDPSAREHLRAAGLERARMFSWERAAHETQAVYDEVFRNSKK
jgi:glycosyltransferase involved in cell wall biosynthesis